MEGASARDVFKLSKENLSIDVFIIFQRSKSVRLHRK